MRILTLTCLTIAAVPLVCGSGLFFSIAQSAHGPTRDAEGRLALVRFQRHDHETLAHEGQLSTLRQIWEAGTTRKFQGLA